MVNRLGTPEDQPNYKKGYNAFFDGITKNPFENLSHKFQTDMIYWELGWGKAKEDEKAEKTMNSLPTYI